MFASLHKWFLEKRVVRLQKKNRKLMDKLHYKYGTWS